ncbi:MAG: M13 family peptidase, partial [Lysobacter sp.]|nr:M13 family peptidase [Lysobacter sp.]
MQHRIGWILTTALIVGCTAQTPSTPDATKPAASTTASTGAPTIGIDLAGIDKAVKPGDDFEEYANGAWRNKTEIPADRASIGTGFYVYELSEKRTRDLIQNAGKGNPAAGTNERKIADYYAAYMDEGAIEKRGLQAIDADLKAIDAITDLRTLSAALGAQVRADTDPLNSTNFDTEHLFGVFVSQPLDKAGPQVPYLMQGGLGMPNRDYYLEASLAKQRDAYLAYIEKILTASGTPDAKAKAKAIFDLETKIAKAHADVVTSSDVHKSNNPWPIGDYAKKAPGIDWPTFFDAAGIGGQPIVFAWQDDAIANLSALVAKEPLQTWKDWMRFHTINHGAGLLPKAYSEAAFDFYGKSLSGTTQQTDRWK